MVFDQSLVSTAVCQVLALDSAVGIAAFARAAAFWPLAVLSLANIASISASSAAPTATRPVRRSHLRSVSISRPASFSAPASNPRSAAVCSSLEAKRGKYFRNCSCASEPAFALLAMSISASAILTLYSLRFSGFRYMLCTVTNWLRRVIIAVALDSVAMFFKTRWMKSFGSASASLVESQAAPQRSALASESSTTARLCKVVCHDLSSRRSLA